MEVNAHLDEFYILIFIWAFISQDLPTDYDFTFLVRLDGDRNNNYLNAQPKTQLG